MTGGAGIQSCPTCSGGADVGYVGNNSGTLQFNGVTANTSDSYVVTIWYTNGDAARYALLSVNGGPGIPVSFPVHWLVSDRRLNTDDDHFERRQQQHAYVLQSDRW